MSVITLRLAKAGDVAETAALVRRVRQANLPYLPDLHTPDEDCRYFRGLVRDHTVWLAERGGAILGFMASSGGWLHHLYVDVPHQGHGIGSALLDKAKAGERELQLWVFQKNDAARRFYERRGFRLVEETDGSANEEKEPDVLLAWRRPDRS